MVKVALGLGVNCTNKEVNDGRFSGCRLSCFCLVYDHGFNNLCFKALTVST